MSFLYTLHSYYSVNNCTQITDNGSFCCHYVPERERQVDNQDAILKHASVHLFSTVTVCQWTGQVFL